MRKKQLGYGLYGLLAGIVIAFVMVFGERRLIHQSQIIINVFTVLAACVISVVIALRLGRRNYIKRCLGIDEATEKYVEAEHDWIAITWWTDKKEAQYFSIETKKVDGLLCSSINGELYCNYVIPNADYQTVTRFHRSIVQQVVDKLVDEFDEEKIPEIIHF